MKSSIEYSREDLETKPEIAKKLGLHKRSITPTTFKAVEFEKSEKDLYYKEYYKYKNNEVTRFAINYSAVEAESLKSIRTLDTTKEKIESVKTTVYKDSKTKEIINNLLHSDLEKHLIQEAVNHLLDNKDIKTVLVDILERNLDAVVCDAGIPRIHTVVLYKNPTTTDKYEIVVIDPSSFFFSSHLSNIDIQLSVKHDLLDKISTRYDEIKIYTAPNKDNIGSKPNQWRDCIDVAVKLAFALNKEAGDFKIDLNSITKYPFVQIISNMPNIDKSIIDKDDAVRIKQSSSIDEVKKFKACTEAINKIKKIVFLIDEDLSIKISGQYNDLLNKGSDYGTLIHDLLGLDGKVKGFIQDTLEQDYTQLSGFVATYNTDEV